MTDYDLNAILDDLAAAVTAAGIPCTAAPGRPGAGGVSAWLDVPRLTVDQHLRGAGPRPVEATTVPLVLCAAGPDPDQLRDLNDRLMTVLDAVPAPWRLATDVVAGTTVGEDIPAFVLTLRR